MSNTNTQENQQQQQQHLIAIPRNSMQHNGKAISLSLPKQQTKIRICGKITGADSATSSINIQGLLNIVRHCLQTGHLEQIDVTHGKIVVSFYHKLDEETFPNFLNPYRDHCATRIMLELGLEISNINVTKEHYKALNEEIRSITPGKQSNIFSVMIQLSM
ncbi:unnamed protein product [Ambrosiozyma monospora]|uniref:Unnamed protein product n=1 Tax=Ambrosiozyma monospora TaxID=43982 RepID=A0ACB5SZI5_AMBMO|nr:unnamed protein product [Ambrosiozyma monospora]